MVAENLKAADEESADRLRPDSRPGQRATGPGAGSAAREILRHHSVRQSLVRSADLLGSSVTTVRDLRRGDAQNAEGRRTAQFRP